MKTVHFLDQKPDFDFDVFAINSHSKAYVLCWHINNDINACFKKSKGIFFSEKEVYSQFKCSHEGFDMSIIQNKSKWGFLMPEQNKIDFFLKLHLRYHPIKKKILCKNLTRSLKFC
jgi:hypothetical protein